MENSCRLCLNQLKNSGFIILNDHLSAKEKLHVCVPEININLLEKSLMCSPCETALNNAYIFKKNCLQSEKYIRNYYLKNKNWNADKVQAKKETVRNGLPSNKSENDNLKNKSQITITLTNNLLQSSQSKEKPNDLKRIKLNNSLPEISVEPAIKKIRVNDTDIMSLKLNEIEMTVCNRNKNYSPILSDNSNNLDPLDEVKSMNESSDDFEESVHTEINELCIVSFDSKSDECPKKRNSIETPLQDSDVLTRNSLEKEQTSNCVNKKQIESGKSNVQVSTNECRLKCNVCNIKFGQEQKLKLHLKTTHSDMVVCEICNATFSSNKDLTNHIFIHVNYENYNCEFCNYKCLDRPNFIKHIQIHNDVKSLSCKYCEYKCLTKLRLARHIKIHGKEKHYKCPLCDYKCTQKQNLDGHIRTHTGDKPYQCKHCDYKTSYVSGLSHHKQTHNKVKAFQCEICNYVGTSKFNLMRHLKNHTFPKYLNCKVCSYHCATATELAKHVRVHTDEKSFVCDSCEFKCSTRETLMIHLRTHSTKVFFECDFCDHKSKSVKSITEHIHTTHPSIYLTCEVCGYKCRMKTQLQGHTCASASVKSFVCKVCGCKFSQESKLENHMRQHQNGRAKLSDVIVID